MNVFKRDECYTICCLLNTSVGPLHCKGEGGTEESVRCFGDVAVDLLVATTGSMLRWCTQEGSSTKLLRSLGLDEVDVGHRAMMGRKEVSHKAVEVGFGSFLLSGPSRTLRWVAEEEEAQIRCLTHKDGHLHLHLNLGE